MLNRGVETGYAIKRTVDLGTRFFWAASLAQVYPELAALESERIPEFEFRDEGLLRRFFADAMTPKEALELVKRLRIRAEEIGRVFRAEILPLAQGAPGRFPLIAAREGADSFEWRAAGFRKLETELADELDSGGS